MKVQKVDQSQNFRGLNIDKVAHGHKKFIRANWGEIKKLSEQYDITMKTKFGEDAYYDGISIIVKPLRKNVKFFQKFNRPKGESFFYTDCRSSNSRKDTTVLGQLKEALADLRKNSLLKALS